MLSSSAVLLPSLAARICAWNTVCYVGKEVILNPDVAKGIEVTLLGMTLEFIILGVVWLAMVILERVFRPAPAQEE